VAEPRGTISRLPSGRFRVRLPRSILPPKTTPGPDERRVSQTFDTEEEARQMLQALLEAAEVPEPTGTLRAWGVTWLERRERRGLAGADTDRGRWARLVEGSPLGELGLRSITPPRVAAWSRWLAEQPRLRQARGGGYEAVPGSRLSRQTQAHALNLLRAALDDAVLEGLIPVNPAAVVGVEPADQGDDLDAWTWLATGEIAQLLRSERVPEPARLLYQVAIYTGLRAGELWALRWEAVRLGDLPQITVSRSNRRRSTKSGKVRAVPLLPQALEALQRWHALCGAPAAGLVWPAEDGGQRPRGDDFGWADRRRGAQALQLGHRSLARLRDGVRFHDLRHTCASHLLQGSWGRRWTLEEVRDFLGHCSITVTQRYAHLNPAALHAAAAATTTRGSDEKDRSRVDSGRAAATSGGGGLDGGARSAPPPGGVGPGSGGLRFAAGGQGVVVRAHHRSSDQAVAVVNDERPTAAERDPGRAADPRSGEGRGTDSRGDRPAGEGVAGHARDTAPVTPSATRTDPQPSKPWVAGSRPAGRAVGEQPMTPQPVSRAVSRPPAAIAAELLRAVAQGAPGDRLAADLARAVLEEPAARLALAVAAGGDHALDRALELAGLLLRPAAARRQA